MFRYYCSAAYPTTLSWNDSSAGSFVDVVEHYYGDNCFKHDADNCGENEKFLVVRAPDGETKYFKLTYSWYMPHEGDEYIINEHEITEVKKEDTTDLVEDRDWMRVSRSYYPKIAWPPVPTAA